MFSLNGTLKKSGSVGNGKRNNLLGWPNNNTATSHNIVNPTGPTEGEGLF